MSGFKCVCVCRHVYRCVYMYTFVCVCVYMGVCTRVSLCMCVYVCIVACCSDFELVRAIRTWWQEIQIGVHCELDTLAIWRPTHEMIQRFIPICAVKTRQRFASKITSFYVSVCSYVISLFTVVSRCLYVTRIISCERLISFTSMIMCITSWDIYERPL